MLQTMFPFDIFGFISGFFILIFVIVIIVFIIIIIVVYKLLHSNVDHKSKTRYKMPKLHTEDVATTFVKIDEENLTQEKISSKCKYCGEKIEEDIAFCPFCGSNLSE
jgi:uncharacterized membrane protein